MSTVAEWVHSSVGPGEVPATATIPKKYAAPLENRQYERMAQELFKGAHYTEAYVTAGFKAHKGNAHRLSTHEAVKGRLAALQAMAAAKIVKDVANYDKGYVLRQAVRLHETAMAHIEGPDGFNAAAGNVASRALGQVGDHVDVQAFAKQQDINITLTVDAGLSKLEALTSAVIEGEYSDVTSDGID